MKVDKWHYHEAADRAFMLITFIDESVCKHPVYEQAPENMQFAVAEAMNKLYEYYHWASTINFEMED